MVEVKTITPCDEEIPELISEKKYASQMETVVGPYLDAVRIKGRFLTQVRLSYELYPLKSNRGTIVICHGYTESCSKFYELIYYFLKARFQVAVFDQRGHGDSQRLVREKELIHVDHFDDYITDLHAFVHQVVLRKMTVDQGRFYLFGHSMGGCISARYIETYPYDFKKAALNAPMMAINFGKLPVQAAKAVCIYNFLRGKRKQHIFNQYRFDFYPDFEDCSCTSGARYYYYHKVKARNKNLQMSRATYQWGYEATVAGEKARSQREVEKIQIPVMMFIAENDRLVERKAQDEFLKYLKSGSAVFVPDSRHEIYRSSNPVLKTYLGTLIRFFGK